jgi:peptidoglycan-N-acetylglucosamine deacetylase
MSVLAAVAVLFAIGAEAPASAVPVPDPPATSAASRSARASQPVRPPDDDRTVALTFDDGPSPYTPAILAVLRREHIHATFCMLGDEAQRHPAPARQVVREGHQVCNHTRDHVDMARLPAKRARRELVAAERQIRDAAGIAPTIFRFPYGSSDREARQVVRGYGMRILNWDVDPRDWTRPGPSAITARIDRGVRHRSVVLLHDGGGDRSSTVGALDATIRSLKRRGYRFVPA